MPEFVVHGPFSVPLERLARGAIFLDPRAIEEFARQEPLMARKGCYVFVWKASRGSLPIYVGMTQKQTIGQEAFNPRNTDLINRFINTKLKGSLQLYVLVEADGPGRDNIPVIKEIEEFLITKAALRNKNLLNSKMTTEPSWIIRGVHNHRGGHPGGPAATFKSVMGLKKSWLSKLVKEEEPIATPYE